jgi:hypothetical protein
MPYQNLERISSDIPIYIQTNYKFRIFQKFFGFLYWSEFRVVNGWNPICWRATTYYLFWGNYTPSFFLAFKFGY